MKSQLFHWPVGGGDSGGVDGDEWAQDGENGGEEAWLFISWWWLAVVVDGDGVIDRTGSDVVRVTIMMLVTDKGGDGGGGG